MRKINLQMFAYDPNSIVDYLKSTGQDSSYSARKELAKSLGISNYSGSGAQNTQMLNALKNSSATPSTSSSSGNSSSSPRPSGAPADTPSISAGNAPSGSYSNYYTKENPYIVPSSGSSSKKKSSKKKEINPFSQSSTSKKAQQTAQQKLEALDKFDVDSIISQETWDAINTPFNASTAYQDAMKYTNELLAQLSSGRTSYTDQIKDMLSQIQNRDKFSYDMSNDTLFQQSLASAMASGKTAMQDTMGQAAALTGGYGSTYATTAANQQYNAFIEDAYNNLPEYYEMALKAYEMEGNEMYNQLSALNAADASEYEKMYNSWNSNFQSAQQMYQNEYTAWQDSVNTAIKNAGLQMDEFSTKYDQAYKTYQANQSYADTLYAQEFNKWSAEEDLGLSYAQMAQNQSQYDSDLKYKYDSLSQNQSQYDSDLKYKYDSLSQNQSQYESDLKYKYDALDQDMTQYEKDLALQYEKLAQDQAQFNATLASKKSSGGGSGSGGSSSSSSKNSNPTETQMKNALKYYEEGGDTGLEKYLASLGKDAEADEAFLTELIDYAHNYGVYTEPEVELEKRTFTKTNDTFNWLWGDDNNDVVVDQYGNEYRIDELPERLRGELTKLKKGESYTAK